MIYSPERGDGKMFRSIVSGCVTFIAISQVLAGEELVERYSTSPGYELCVKRSAATQDILLCMKKELSLQDEALDRAYKRAMERLDTKRRELLRRAQRSWLSYRDAGCSLYYHEKSGSGGLEDMQECLIRETARRIAQLSKLSGR